MIEVFKRALDHYGVTGKELSQKTGIAQATISDIRRGKSDPSLGTFWRLIQAAEEIAPGFLKYFCRLLVCGSDEVGELEAMIAVADQEEIGLAMMAMARRWNELAKPDKALPNKIAVWFMIARSRAKKNMRKLQ